MKKELRKQRKKSFKIKLGRWKFLAGLVLFFGLLIPGDFGLYTRIKLLRQRHELEKQIIKEMQMQALLEEKINSIKTDDKALERHLRENMGMGYDDEVIIKFNDEKEHQLKNVSP